jgi:anti-sigma regulatory factor (Ser/Thr protein kinase)
VPGADAQRTPPGGRAREPVSLAGPRWQAIEQGFDLRLGVPADAAALSVVRHAAGGVAVALGMGPADVADVRLAVTEVCSTAIRRVEGNGTLEVACGLDGAALRVTVRDEGARGAQESPAEGLPLPLVAALTETIELRRLKAPHAAGTEVTMTFALEAA